MLDGLEDIAWERLEHSYGMAEEIPELLRARRCSAEPDWDLAELLWNRDEVNSASIAALPFLVELVSSVDTPERAALLVTVACLARDGVDDPDWSTAWRRVRPRVLALVEDADPEVRRHAWHTFGSGRGPADGVLEVVRRCWSDVPSRLDIVVAAGEFADDAEIAAWLRGLPVDDPQLRLAVAYALRLGIEEFLPGFTADMAVWRETASFGFAPSHAISKMTEAFADRPAEHTALLRELSTAPHRRVAVVRNAAVLLYRWRSPAADLLPIVASFLADPDVRAEALHLLGCARAEEYADEMAALLDDEPAGAEAAWALARCGRKVPDLVRRSPSVVETLGSLAAQALPDVSELVQLLDTDLRPKALVALGRIGTPVPELAPVDPLSAWAWWRCGGDPAEAADVIAGELDVRGVRMLADIGPGAAHLVDRLPMPDSRIAMRVATRHAFFRLTGEAGDLVPTCVEALDGVDGGRFRSVMIPAAWALVAAGARFERARAALTSDRRLCRAAGARGFDQDDDLRRALRQL